MRVHVSMRVCACYLLLFSWSDRIQYEAIEYSQPLVGVRRVEAWSETDFAYPNQIRLEVMQPRTVSPMSDEAN